MHVLEPHRLAKAKRLFDQDFALLRVHLGNRDHGRPVAKRCHEVVEDIAVQRGHGLGANLLLAYHHEDIVVWGPKGRNPSVAEHWLLFLLREAADSHAQGRVMRHLKVAAATVAPVAWRRGRPYGGGEDLELCVLSVQSVGLGESHFMLHGVQGIPALVVLPATRHTERC